jgi:Ca2+-binding RTX toxin-like protein
METYQYVLAPNDLLISEYIEGSGNNKALEFYNGTGSATVSAVSILTDTDMENYDRVWEITNPDEKCICSQITLPNFRDISDIAGIDINNLDKNQKVIGSLLNNFIYGLQGNKNLAGKSGNDIIFGDTSGNTFSTDMTIQDFLLCNQGNDYLNGNFDKDILHGGKDNDLINGGKDSE